MQHKNQLDAETIQEQNQLIESLKNQVEDQQLSQQSLKNQVVQSSKNLESQLDQICKLQYQNNELQSQMLALSQNALSIPISAESQAEPDKVDSEADAPEEVNGMERP